MRNRFLTDVLHYLRWWSVRFWLLLMMMVLRLFALLVYIFGWCNGHAIFWEPPSRASLGKHNMNFCKVPINNDHMSLYCGGIQVRLSLWVVVLQGVQASLITFDKIGPASTSRREMWDLWGRVRVPPATARLPRKVCDRHPRPLLFHSWSGMKSSKWHVMSSTFATFKVIEVIIDVVANHKGFFAFRLCPNNNPQKAPNAKCFSHFPLKLANGESFHFLEPTARMGTRVRLQVKLPDGLECWQCIIQWSYVAGKKGSWTHFSDQQNMHAILFVFASTKTD